MRSDKLKDAFLRDIDKHTVLKYERMQVHSYVKNFLGGYDVYVKYYFPNGYVNIYRRFYPYKLFSNLPPNIKNWWLKNDLSFKEIKYINNINFLLKNQK